MVTVLLVSASIAPLPAAQRLVDVRQIATDTLHDVAVATYERGRPVIYYNPILIQRVGPELADFFLAHEYGHIAYGHAGGALAEPRDDWGSRRCSASVLQSDGAIPV
jgi:Zn-dependent peptidase ImmA (M78 family)